MKNILNKPGLIEKNSRFIKAVFVVIALLLFDNTVFSQQQFQKEKVSGGDTPKASQKAAYQLSHKIIPSEQNSFGYDILMNSRLMVHQPSIPGLPGNKGFGKKEDAEKCAQLVMDKIRRNIMPPTVTLHELDSLKIKF